MTTDTKAKIVEWLRGERDWEQMDMARECLAEIDRAYKRGTDDGMAAQRFVNTVGVSPERHY